MTETLWHGFKAVEFEFEGKYAILVFPEKADEAKNWMLKTEYFGAFPQREIDLLNRGLHLAYIKNENRFATEADCHRKARFADYLHDTFGLRDKCLPVGMSLGGAHAMNFAGFHPEKAVGLFLDAPVLNFMSYPGDYRSADCRPVWDEEFVKAYPGITRAQLLNFSNHPIGKVPVLLAHKIPILMLWGTQDATVDYENNGRLLEMEYDPTLLTVIPRNAQGHHPHGDVPQPETVIELLLQFCRQS